MLYLHDFSYPLWDSDRPVWWWVFEDRGGVHRLAGMRDGRWVVEAAGPFDPGKRVASEPRASLPPVPFEVFQTEIDRPDKACGSTSSDGRGRAVLVAIFLSGLLRTTAARPGASSIAQDRIPKT